MGEPNEDQHNGAGPNEAAEDPDFDFEAWAKEAGLLRKTTAKLRQEDLCTKRTLALLVNSDIRELSLAIGQRKLLEAAVQKLTPATSGQPTQEPSGRSTSEAGTSAQTEPAATETPELEANAHAKGADGGDTQRLTIGQLRRLMQNDSQLEGAGKTLDAILGISPPSTCSSNETVNQTKHAPGPDSAFDPRTMLTIKSSSTKAVHITQFISEATKKRRQSRKRQFVVSQKGGDSELVIATDDDHPYSGLTIEEWSAANCRVMAHLLQTGQLATADIDFYLAYTVQIYEFAQRYQWEGLMDFDYQYRERQAQYSFLWGTNTGNMELSLLHAIPRRPDVPRQSKPYYNTAVHPKRDVNPRPKQSQECRLYKTRGGNCPFGTSCIYYHPPPASRPLTPKNQ